MDTPGPCAFGACLQPLWRRRSRTIAAYIVALPTHRRGTGASRSDVARVHKVDPGVPKALQVLCCQCWRRRRIRWIRSVYRTVVGRPRVQNPDQMRRRRAGWSQRRTRGRHWPKSSLRRASGRRAISSNILRSLIEVVDSTLPVQPVPTGHAQTVRRRLHNLDATGTSPMIIGSLCW
jgi:hypothetical protein